MGMFGFKKRDRVIDLTEHYKKQQEQIDAMKEEAKETSMASEHATETSGGVMSFFGDIAASSTPSTEPSSEETESMGTANPDERKRRLAKRLTDMTEKIEDLSNQIYHLQQRFEVVERKLHVNKFND